MFQGGFGVINSCALEQKMSFHWLMSALNISYNEGEGALIDDGKNIIMVIK